MSDGYRPALARIHDEAFGFIATGAAKVLIAGLRLNGFSGGQVVELAGGGGISSRMIVDAGFDVVGCDISPAMIDLARRRVPEGEFAVCSLYDMELPSGCVAVTAIGEALNYRFDERAGPRTMEEVFSRVHDALVPGGIFIFDVALSMPAMPRMEHMMWEGPGWQVTSETVENPDEATLERRIVSRTGPDLGEVDIENHLLALYRHEDVFAALRECGFDVATLASYAEDHRFSVHHGGFYAVKL